MIILETDLGGRLASLDLLALVFEASWVVQAVLLLLVVLSVFSWAVILYKSRELRGAEQDSEALLEMYHEGSLEETWEASRDLERSPLAAVFVAAYGDLLRVERETGRAASLEPGLPEALISRTHWAGARELRRLESGWLSHHTPFRGFADGYLNPRAGWVESGQVVAHLASAAVRAGVRIVRSEVEGFLGEERVRGLRTRAGDLEADFVVVATGAWTPCLLPELGDRITCVGQPVLHLRADPSRYGRGRFRPWAADIANTGWYGFPALEDGTLKVANHGAGIRVDPRGVREVPREWEDRCRAFLRRHLPDLSDAPLVATRLCLYADTFDGDFFIDAHPDREGVWVSTGGSGHGFKFAPVLGRLLADAVEGVDLESRARFRWRPLGAHRTESARSSVGEAS